MTDLVKAQLQVEQWVACMFNRIVVANTMQKYAGMVWSE
jgi:hypothetical protein